MNIPYLNVSTSLIKEKEISHFFALNHTVEKKLFPLLKWPGGKEQELKYIIPNLPENFQNYYDPFVGGGSVFTAVNASHYFVNDKSNELISLYRSILGENRERFFDASDEIVHNWKLLGDVTQKNRDFFVDAYKMFSKEEIDVVKFKNILFEFILKNSRQFNGMFSTVFNFNIENFIKEIKINLVRKTKRMKIIEQARGDLSEDDILDNIETSLKSAFYMHFRHIQNNVTKYQISEAFKSAIFLFIRNFAYSGMFRYNSKGSFNVPYGGIGYNRKNYLKKINYLRGIEIKRLLEKTTIENLDFEEFMNKQKPRVEDFVFLDPPYDSEFSTYAKNEFTKDDQKRLANYLQTKCEARWMLIIKETDLIKNLYMNKGLRIRIFSKKYLVSFMNRNDKNANHLLITNY